ncbi:uncharacterized protein [Rutidosis leptorrhynchoides]|uniref:uncharacterized protein n=1 Tax=Rutidosis leptorrhynchoides TaxID=125765 RepID=UPI003A992BFE
MPRSSRSKSHKQSSKHTSSSTAREYSGSDDDVKTKERSSNGGKEDIVSVRVSSEKRKHNKDVLISHVNGDVVVSDKNHGGSDRWNGGSSDVVVNVDHKEVSKSKGSSELKNKSGGGSSRRHESDSVVVVDEIKSGSASNRSEKRKSEKESGRNESLYKEIKDSKDKDRSSDRGRKGHSDKVEVDGLLKQGENQSSKRGKEITDWPIEQELRNPELEKELEKRVRRRREGSNDKDNKYQDDVKETDVKRPSSRTERSKDERHKNEEYVDIITDDNYKETDDRRLSSRTDRSEKHKNEEYVDIVTDADYKEPRQRGEKHNEDGERDRKNRDVKHRGESDRYNKHRDDKLKYREDKYNEDGDKDKDRDNKYKDEKYGDKDERIRDGKRKQDDDRDHYKHKEDKHRDVRNRDDYDREKRARDSKYSSRDYVLEPETKRLRDDRNTSNRDRSPIYDDRVTRYKDEKDKDRRRGNDKDESSEYRSRKDQRPESDKRSSSKVDPVSERGRPGSRYTDPEVSRRRSSPGASSYPARDHYRGSKQEEAKYRDYTYEDQTRPNAHSSRNYDSAPGQSDKKVAPKDENYSRPDSRSSPQVDKSPSSTSNERRNLTRPDIRKSLDLYEPGPKSGGSKDTVKDPDTEFSQPDNDNISVSSPYTRNPKSLLPPPSPSSFKTRSDSPFFGSTDDDRNKSNNRHRRMVDPNMGRSQNNWKNVPNWPSPMANSGYMQFPHVPPPMFHPLMQQFPTPMFGRPPMKLNPGLPYHLPDHGRPPMHGWDGNNNGVFGDEYGRVEWDRRTQMNNNQGWDQSGEMWKGQNAGPRFDVQSGPTQDGPTMGQPDESEQNQLDIQAESLNLETKSALEAQKASISPAQIFEPVKMDNNVLMSKAYLSRVDVSRDLTQTKLYDQCTSMMDLDQEHVSDEFDYKILFFEEGVEANDTDSVSLFTASNDSVFQKAMLLYKKQKDELYSMNEPTAGPEFVDGMVMVVTKEIDEPTIQKLDIEANAVDTEANAVAESAKTEEQMDIEVDRSVVKQDEEEPDITMVAVEESVAPSADVAVMPAETTNDEKNGGGGGGVLSDVATAEVAVMPRESIEFGSVNLNRIHHHSPESNPSPSASVSISCRE